MNQAAPTIKLVDNHDSNTITPFAVPDYKEIKSGRTNNSEHLTFEINAQKINASDLSVSIFSGTTLVYSRPLKPTKTPNSPIPWKWDGFNRQGVFDSKLLKKTPLTIQLHNRNNGNKPVHKLELRAKPAEADWVDIKIDRTKLAIDVELRANIKDGRSKGVGEFPPQEVQDLPGYQNLPATSPKRNKHHQLKGFVALRQLAFDGIRRYWGRNLNMPKNQTYALRVNPVHATTNAMDDIELVYNTNGDYLRSSNPGSVRGFYSLFANVLPERIVYNVGWVEYSNGWGYQPQMDADRAFSETSAHEIGHEILSAYGGDKYSYSHRDSSYIVPQDPKPVAKGGLMYPAAGEIDLMRYYNDRSKPANFYARVIASEVDAKSLIWLSRVQFNDPSSPGSNGSTEEQFDE